MAVNACLTSSRNDPRAWVRQARLVHEGEPADRAVGVSVGVGVVFGEADLVSLVLGEGRLGVILRLRILGN
jgi:hypothetical protein